MQLVFDFPVHPRYSFENFVVCGGNDVAYRFAEMLAADPCQPSALPLWAGRMREDPFALGSGQSA